MDGGWMGEGGEGGCGVGGVRRRRRMARVCEQWIVQRCIFFKKKSAECSLTLTLTLAQLPRTMYLSFDHTVVLQDSLLQH